MERMIFNFARNGELSRLRSILDNKPKEEVSLLVSARTDNSTPLVEACANDNLSVALYLIEECHADIEQVGSTVFDGVDVGEAPPLWYAARSGILRLVKSLVQHGADIEASNAVGRTCLMNACLFGRFEIATYLIDCGADVDRKNEHGRTALHICLDHGYFDILKLLLENGAVLIPTPWGETPLLCAAANGQIAFVEYFIQEFNFTKQEKIDALELLGATVVLENLGRNFAFDCWSRAMKMRYECRDYLKIRPPIAVCLDVNEFRTFSQLEHIISNPDEADLQALVIRERILGSLSFSYTKNKERTYADNGNFERRVELWMYALEVYLIYLQFSIMTSDDRSLAAGYPVVTFHNILRTFERAVKEIERTNILSSCHSFHTLGTIFIALFLLGRMCRLQSQIHKDEALELKRGAYKLVRIVPEILHLACDEHFLSLGVFELKKSSSNQLEVINLLLEVGASPNALNCNQDTPLHVAAANKLSPEAVFMTLLNHGSHLDQCNLKNKTPLQLALHMPLLDVYPLQHVNLQCLSAKAIQRHKIPYKGLVHKKLQVFVDSH